MYRFKLNIPAQELPSEIKRDQEVAFQGLASCDSQVIRVNHDGTETVTSVLRPILVEVRSTDTRFESPVFKGEVKHKSLSQKIRDRLWILHQKSGLKADFETFYEEKMTKYLEFIDQKIGEVEEL